MKRLAGKTAFITGAARGQGRAHAVRLAEEGANIIALDICRDIDTAPYEGSTAADLEHTVELVEAVGGRIIAVEADVRHSQEIEKGVEKGIEAFGGIDVLVVNAGIAGYGQAVEMSENVWQEMIDINLTGAWKTVRAVAPSMVEAGRGGSIILTSSVAGMIAFPNLAHYSAAKHGLIGLMKVLAVELAPKSIRANVICPSHVNTPMIQNPAVYELFTGGVSGATAEQASVAMKSMHALPIPWVESEDISNAVLWLASDEARYVTGVVLPVDGGLTAPFKLPHDA
ncbi:NAD(P)-dependent oxidoreductase [Rhodococcus sp. ABRD24]|uniref:mycofactocin-coupled SDR family oxidoreductase n=1 Tax=Rhodococcus sp. ABRD24 TaxID=2507582 RepID=UPI00103E73BD|nr:mycofactocin-coupled SDR family oxidoreductase [Rhodococcus sp. ABRD24]QBJ96596.1 NAD(P)-dependent oxidoreductase [Rhodococcus sp. ABRD24]